MLEDWKRQRESYEAFIVGQSSNRPQHQLEMAVKKRQSQIERYEELEIRARNDDESKRRRD